MDEDSARAGGSEPLRRPYLLTPVFRIARARVVWLLALAISAVLTVEVLEIFESTLDQVVALALFIPLLTGIGGNTGSRAATTVTRALSLGNVRKRDFAEVAFKEFRTGIALGLALGIIAFCVASLVYGVDIRLVIGITIIANCPIAATMGGLIPLVAQACKVDPAVFSTPFISTFCDATGLLLCFSVAITILGLLGSRGYATGPRNPHGLGVGNGRKSGLAPIRGRSPAANVERRSTQTARREHTICGTNRPSTISEERCSHRVARTSSTIAVRIRMQHADSGYTQKEGLMTTPGENNGDAGFGGSGDGFRSSYSQYGGSSAADSAYSGAYGSDSSGSASTGSTDSGAFPSGPAPYEFPDSGVGADPGYDNRYASGSGYGNPVPPGVGQDAPFVEPGLGYQSGFQPGFQQPGYSQGFQPGFAPGAAPMGQYPGPGAPLVPAYGYAPMGYQPKSYAGAALLAFFLGGLGVHNFYLGYTGKGVAQLIITILGFVTTIIGVGFLLLLAVWIWAFIEFILILCRSGSYGYDSNGVPLV